LKKSEIVSRGLLEAGGEGAETLEVMEEDLDTVALRVCASVEAQLLVTRGIRVDDRLDVQRLQLATNRVRIVARVRYERFAARVMGDDRLGDGRLVLLARREFDVERAPFGVDESVDLRGEATSRTTQRIADDPPFPPAASWWARTTEASIMTPSSSASNWSALKIEAQWPRSDQFEKRLKTVFHEPKRSGRSRHGIPVFAR
jgi:hypothetical protein